ncbi:MAG: FkbM family methyltransferase [Bacteroidales bacterium]
MQKIYEAYAWLFGRPAFSKFNSLVYGLALRGLGVYNYTSSMISGEQWLLDNVVKSLGRDLVVFDVGANIGSYTKNLIDAGVDAKLIYAFEPNPVTFNMLSKNLSTVAYVFPIQAALSDQKGEKLLFDRADGEGTSHASLSRRIFTEIHMIEKTERLVPVDTIDNFSRYNNVDVIDFLKIDVEGYEINVLKGANGLLKNKKIRCIQFEFTQLNSIIGVFFKEFYDILSRDYDIFRLLPHGLKKIEKYNPTTCEIFGYQNYAAILKNHK